MRTYFKKKYIFTTKLMSMMNVEDHLVDVDGNGV